MSTPPRSLAYLCVGVGAAVGTGLRATAERLWPASPGEWPWSTFIINCVGALLLGLLQERLARGAPARWRNLTKLGLGTGVLGGFTTYSTFVMEALQSMRTDALVLAFAYLGVSVVLGVLFARLGLALGDARRPASHSPGPGASGAGRAGGEQPPSGTRDGGDCA
ncbi:CrcB family protein [Galactobacter sp.]|uniref:fluoride efflux transporter FluC n=1 Tax=Galactobacter sp. TaxID=2676125 RepID=UPI0025BDEB99|nr:CrcB family protein [Galactobacter sp.]